MDLKTEYGKRYRVTLDAAYAVENEEGKTKEVWRYFEIKGRYGMVYAYGLNQPAVFFTSNIVANRFNGREGWKVIQNGEDERTVLFPKSDMALVLEAIKARKRRILSESNRLAAIERLKPFRNFFKPLIPPTKTGVEGT